MWKARTSMPQVVTDVDQMKDAWTMIPTLFAIMDEDSTGKVNPRVLVEFLKNFTSSKRIKFDIRICKRVMTRAHQNYRQDLDVREFSSFLSIFAKELNVSLYDLVYHMMELSGEKQAQQSKKLGVFGRLLGGLQAEEMHEIGY
jgi:Ca2+-binding EF-hand superfamily protein